MPRPTRLGRREATRRAERTFSPSTGSDSRSDSGDRRFTDGSRLPIHKRMPRVAVEHHNWPLDIAAGMKVVAGPIGASRARLRAGGMGRQAEERVAREQRRCCRRQGPSSGMPTCVCRSRERGVGAPVSNDLMAPLEGDVGEAGSAEVVGQRIVIRTHGGRQSRLHGMFHPLRQGRRSPDDRPGRAAWRNLTTPAPAEGGGAGAMTVTMRSNRSSETGSGADARSRSQTRASAITPAATLFSITSRMPAEVSATVIGPTASLGTCDTRPVPAPYSRSRTEESSGAASRMAPATTWARSRWAGSSSQVAALSSNLFTASTLDIVDRPSAPCAPSPCLPSGDASHG